MKRFFLLILLLLNSCAKQNSDLIKPQEKNFKSLKQITFGGDNAEAYWSFDDKKIVFQSNNSKWGLECDQMFYGNFDQSYDAEIPKIELTLKNCVYKWSYC
jgi:Tol biopolymer transport system component